MDLDSTLATQAVDAIAPTSQGAEGATGRLCEDPSEDIKQSCSAWLWAIMLSWSKVSIYHPRAIARHNIVDRRSLRSINVCLWRIHFLLGREVGYLFGSMSYELNMFERLWLDLPEALFVHSGSWQRSIKEIGYGDAEIFKEESCPVVVQGDGA